MTRRSPARWCLPPDGSTARRPTHGTIHRMTCGERLRIRRRPHTPHAQVEYGVGVVWRRDSAVHRRSRELLVFEAMDGELQRAAVLVDGTHDVIGAAVWYLRFDLQCHVELGSHQAFQMGDHLVGDRGWRRGRRGRRPASPRRGSASAAAVAEVVAAVGSDNWRRFRAWAGASVRWRLNFLHRVAAVPPRA